MSSITFTTLTNGRATSLLGSGIAHRDLDVHGRAELATDAVLGEVAFRPSRAQASQIFRVPPMVLRQHLQARELAEEYSNRDSNEQLQPLPFVNDGALLRYLRHTHGDVGVGRFIREAKKLVRTIRELAEMRDIETIRELVERINSAPPVL